MCNLSQQQKQNNDFKLNINTSSEVQEVLEALKTSGISKSDAVAGFFEFLVNNYVDLPTTFDVIRKLNALKKRRKQRIAEGACAGVIAELDGAIALMLEKLESYRTVEGAKR